MSKHCSPGAAWVAVLLALPLGAQSPSSGYADFGPLFPVPSTTLSAPAGFVITTVASTSSVTLSPESLELGPGGDLFVAATAGTSCGGLAETTHVYRLPMATLTTPGPWVTYTTVPLAAHLLEADAAGNLYACGTCSQTTGVYRIPPSGVPELLNPTTPLPDPDGLALGALPGVAAPVLFVAVQDGLYALDLGAAPLPAAFPVPVSTAALGIPALGNWGRCVWDPNTQTLLSTYVGSPTISRTAELSVGAWPATVPALDLGPNGVEPQCTDDRGMRWFNDNQNRLGVVDASGPTPVFRPLVAGFASRPRAVAGPEGSLYVLDKGTATIYHLRPTFRVDAIDVSSATGGIVNFALHGPPGHASEPFLIIAGPLGATPGATLGGAVYTPLNVDVFTDLLIIATASGAPYLINWFGFLDAAGQATAAVDVPGAGAVTPGVTVHFTYILAFPPASSNAVSFHFVP